MNSMKGAECIPLHSCVRLHLSSFGIFAQLQSGNLFKSLGAKVDISRIQPVGGNHAIEVMAIAVEWAIPPIDDVQIALLQTVYETNPDIKAFFPMLAPVQAFVFQSVDQFATGADGKGQHEPQNVAPPQFISRKGGFDLQHFDAKGTITWIASIRPELISVNCTAYDSWMNVKSQALAILQPFLDVAMTKGAIINAIGLQYQDAFQLLEGATPAATGELFRKNGSYLPIHLFEQPSLWHCHQGWFSKAPDERRVLNNVATEVTDVNGTHFARIGGQHRIFATSVDGLSSMPITAGEIDQILQYLHDENIDVINGILSEGALMAIGCTGGGS